MDVTTVFLNGKLKEEVYMDQPVCKLKHSLYNLKQAPRCWNFVLDQRLKAIGFVQANCDPCIYVATSGETFIIGIYVDDILLAGKSEKRISEIKLALAKTFEVKDLAELNHFLGVKIVQNHGAGTI